MSELAIIAPKNIAETAELSQRLSKSNLLPEAYRGKEADVFMTLLAGSELGLLPVQSLNAFDVIKGRPAMKPVAMLALVRSHSSVQYIRVQATPTSVTITSKLKGDDFIAETTFSMEQATKAGLASNDAYRKFPQQMLTWRCTGLHCRAHHSDIIGGFYTTEEAETFEKDITPKPGVIDAQPVVDQVKATLKAKTKRVMNIVDMPPAVASPPRAPDGVAFLDWPDSHKGVAVASLRDDQLKWCIDTAQKKLESAPDEARGLWFDRLATFTAELARRGVA